MKIQIFNYQMKTSDVDVSWRKHDCFNDDVIWPFVRPMSIMLRQIYLMRLRLYCLRLLIAKNFSLVLSIIFVQKDRIFFFVIYTSMY